MLQSRWSPSGNGRCRQGHHDSTALPEWRRHEPSDFGPPQDDVLRGRSKSSGPLTRYAKGSHRSRSGIWRNQGVPMQPNGVIPKDEYRVHETAIDRNRESDILQVLIDNFAFVERFDRLAHQDAKLFVFGKYISRAGKKATSAELEDLKKQLSTSIGKYRHWNIIRFLPGWRNRQTQRT